MPAEQDAEASEQDAAWAGVHAVASAEQDAEQVAERAGQCAASAQAELCAETAKVPAEVRVEVPAEQDAAWAEVHAGAPAVFAAAKAGPGAALRLSGAAGIWVFLHFRVWEYAEAQADFW